MSTNIKLSGVDGERKRMKKSYLEVLNQARRSVPEKSPLKTLIELNREKRIREVREKILERTRPSAIKKTGTLIIGVRCKDGIIIGSDRKIIRGGETEYSNKVFQFDIGGKILFAAEGLTGIRDDFFLLLNYEIARRRGVDTLYEVKIVIEDIISELTERYRDRIREPYPIGVLMGGLEKLSKGKAVLYYIHSEGYGEQVTFRCTGHGGDYAYSLAKFLYGSQLASESSTKDIAKRVAFVISWIADDVDSMVGGNPDVFMVKDNNRNVEQLAKEDVDEEIKHAKETKEGFSNLLFSRK